MLNHRSFRKRISGHNWRVQFGKLCRQKCVGFEMIGQMPSSAFQHLSFFFIYVSTSNGRRINAFILIFVLFDSCWRCSENILFFRFLGILVVVSIQNWNYSQVCRVEFSQMQQPRFANSDHNRSSDDDDNDDGDETASNSNHNFHIVNDTVEPSQLLRILLCVILEVFTYSLLFYKQLHHLQTVWVVIAEVLAFA